MNSGSNDDDLTLVRKAAGGDQEALDRLMARHADALYAFIAYHTGSGPDAEDLWQESLVKAVRSLPAFEGRSSFFTWLCTIARHQMIDQYRRRGKLEALSVALDEAHLPVVLDPFPLPEEVLQRKNTRLQVLQTLQALPDDYRIALVERYADGQSVQSIARQLGRSYKGVESLLSRARQQFARLFLAGGDDESTYG